MSRSKEPTLALLGNNPYSSEHDRISFLPDELCIQILSHMTVRQAVNTSVLSKRWKNLWTRIPCLRFDGLNMFGQEVSYVTQRLKTHEFVSGVNTLINQMIHRSLSLSSFSVYYELDERYVSYIDDWVLFAIEHGVKKLDLFFRKQDTIDWLFPFELDSIEKLSSLIELRLGGIEILPCFVGFKNLNLVSLTSVFIIDDAFDDLLSNCLLLVDLFVCSATNLKCVKIPESMVRLRFLHIYLCPDLLELEVNSPNLVIFSYVGVQTKLSFNNISNLMLLRLGRLDEVFIQLMSNNLLLQSLSLDLDLFCKDLDTDFMMLPTLTNLKTLTLSIVRLNSGLAGIANLLRATPSLIKFDLNLKDPDFVISELNESLPQSFYHEGLREIEIRGFSGTEGHIKLACFLIEKAVALENITIFPYHIMFYGNQCLPTEPDRDQLDAIRNSVDQISCKLPSTVKLAFIEP